MAGMEKINNFKKIFYLVIVIFFIACFLFLPKKNIQTDAIQYIKIAGQTVKVDLALTPGAQEQGLSERTSLEENKGMLFVFSKPARYSFWMKDMNFPLDMIWINENLQVIYIAKDADPSSYPGTFSPSSDAKYVLEVNADFLEKNNLKEGDTVQFLP